MEDLPVFFFVGIGLCYVGWVLYSLYKFKNSALKEGFITRKKLYLEIWKLTKHTLIFFLTITIIGWFTGYVIMRNSFNLNMIGSSVACLFGMFAWSLPAFGLLVFVLRRLFGLPIE